MAEITSVQATNWGARAPTKEEEQKQEKMRKEGKNITSDEFPAQEGLEVHIRVVDPQEMEKVRNLHAGDLVELVVKEDKDAREKSLDPTRDTSMEKTTGPGGTATHSSPKFVQEQAKVNQGEQKSDKPAEKK